MNLTEFNDQIVFGWIKKDIERIMIELPARSGEAGNVNFPLALCVLEYIQYLGSFLLGLDSNNPTQNIKSYVQNCMPYSNEYPEDLLADIFRNGLAHDYFARGGVSRDGLRPALYRTTIGPVLDVETLTHDFLNSLPNFKAKLTPSNYASRMTQILDTVSKLQARHKKTIDTLPTHQIRPITNPNKNNILASGASGPSGPMTFTTSSGINNKNILNNTTS